VILPSFASRTALGAVPVCFEPSRRALMRRVINSLAVLVLLLAPAGGSADGLSAKCKRRRGSGGYVRESRRWRSADGDPFVMLHKGQ